MANESDLELVEKLQKVSNNWPVPFFDPVLLPCFTQL